VEEPLWSATLLAEIPNSCPAAIKRRSMRSTIGLRALPVTVGLLIPHPPWPIILALEFGLAVCVGGRELDRSLRGKLGQSLIYERAGVNRLGAGFASPASAHPLRRRLRSIWPISDLSADEVVVPPVTHPLSLRPRESFLPRCRQCTKRRPYVT